MADTTTTAVQQVTDADFDKSVLQSGKPALVDFWAPWCGPCKTLGPMLEDAVRAARGAVKMVKVNVDEAQRIAAQLQIQSIPTVYAFYKGQPIDGFQGALPGPSGGFGDRPPALAPQDRDLDQQPGRPAAVGGVRRRVRRRAAARAGRGVRRRAPPVDRG